MAAEVPTCKNQQIYGFTSRALHCYPIITKASVNKAAADNEVFLFYPIIDFLISLIFLFPPNILILIFFLQIFVIFLFNQYFFSFLSTITILIFFN